MFVMMFVLVMMDMHFFAFFDAVDGDADMCSADPAFFNTFFYVFDIRNAKGIQFCKKCIGVRK